ncbi:MAG: hypothetical protein SPG64_04040 [Candidatus Enteromonas sp.]|nr:hypothetical protein [Candidatus Enteromonas sp.]
MERLNGQYVSEYRNEGYLPVSKRIYASVLDSLLLIIVSFALMILSANIAGSVPSYANEISSINSRRIEMYELQEETNLYEFPELENGEKDYTTPVSQNDVFKEYCVSHILYSYSLHAGSWDSTFTLEDDNPLVGTAELNLQAASYSNDRLAYFYVTYAKDHNENDDLFSLKNGETYETHYKTLLQNASKGAEWDYYVGTDTLPSLKMEYAHTLYRYVMFGEGGQDGLNSYNYLISQYQTLFDDAGQLLYRSTPYQTIYQGYLSSYAFCSHVVSLFSVLSYLVAYLIFMFLPALFTKHHVTLGLFVFKGVVLHSERLDASKGQAILRSLVGLFTFFPTMLFSCFFAGGLNSGWMYPLFTIGGAGISLFNLTVISFIFPIVNVLLCLIRSDNRALNELLSNTIVVDRAFYVPLEAPIEEEPTPKEEENAGTDVYIPPYFDSSCFDNTERKTKDPD